MNRCKVCVAPVLECNKRRRLDSPQSEHCRALVGLACNVAIGITKNDAAIEIVRVGFVCKKTLKEKLINKLHEKGRPYTICDVLWCRSNSYM